MIFSKLIQKFFNLYVLCDNAILKIKKPKSKRVRWQRKKSKWKLYLMKVYLKQ